MPIPSAAIHGENLPTATQFSPPGGEKSGHQDRAENPKGELDAGRRRRCVRCGLPLGNCWCGHLVTQTTDATFIFLQHPAEARNPLGTARMAHLSLPDSHLFVGTDFSQIPQLQKLLDGASCPGVLFPSDSARDLTEFQGTDAHPTLVVIDGTWSQARKIWKENEFLQKLPAYRFQPAQPSRYRIRAEPEAHCVSTIEAVAEMLTAIDGQDHQSMLRPFLKMVDRQVAESLAPTRNPRRCVRTRQKEIVPQALLRNVSSLVLVHALSNGYTALHKGHPPMEMVCLEAWRLATGERLSLVMMPANRGPGFASLNLTGEDLRRALDCGNQGRGIVEAWRSFIHRDDVPVLWSSQDQKLLALFGLDADPAPRFFLKHIASNHMGRCAGTIFNAAANLGAKAVQKAEADGRESKENRCREELGLMKDMLDLLLEKSKEGRGTSVEGGR